MLDKIKELLGEELSKQVSEKLGTVELAIMNDGSVVKAEKHDALKSEYKQFKDKYEADLGDMNKKLESATKNVTDIEELQKNIDILKQENEDALKKHQSETLAIKKTSAIEMALLKANVKDKYINVLKTQINQDNLTFEGDKLIGLGDAIDGLKTNFTEMFGETKKMGTPPSGGEQKNPPVGKKAELMKAYDDARANRNFAQAMAIQREIAQLKE